MHAISLLPPAALGQLRRALPPPHTVSNAGTWDELIDRVRRGTADVVIVDPCVDARGTPLERRLASLRRAMATAPWGPVVGYVPVTAAAIRGVQQLVGFGATEIIVRGVDDAIPQLAGIIERAVAGAGARRLHPLLGPATTNLPDGIRAALGLLFAHPNRIRSVPDLAAAAGTTRRSLDRWLARAGLAPARTLVACARACAAFHLVAAGGVRRDRAAIAVGYPSARALSRAIRRTIGMRLSDFPGRLTSATFVAAISSQLRRGKPATSRGSAAESSLTLPCACAYDVGAVGPR